eukprot:TRINITY_DN3070_c0_g2_i2.p1 TRINITY_DN3070_c0_g2~~TRINITY_DN3070_c0_g2_i2.p1  ORF type:complete len:655 (-),score=160.88 TRINITY_DN3070_c0_g2_i2:167-2131(-)
MLLMGLNTFPEGLFLWSTKSRRITFANDAFVSMSNRTRKEIEEHQGDPVDFWIGENAKGEVRSSLKEMFNNPKNFSFDFEVKSNGKDSKWLSVHMAPTGEKEDNHYYFGVLADITFRKTSEIELQKSQLEALTAKEAKDSFLANMSHEIRTPLNAICASSELILESVQDGEQKELTHLINSSSHTLLALVNDILDYSKMEKNNMEFTSSCFELRNCMESCIDLLYIKAAQRKLQLSFHIDQSVPSHIVTEDGRLRQIVTNLLSNAVNFTQTGEIELSISLDNEFQVKNENSVAIKFSIRDTGMGIKERNLSRITQHFEGRNEKALKKSEVGLGLRISHDHVVALNGKIEVESVLGEGSVFAFTIPVVKGNSSKRSFSSVFESKSICLVASGSNERMIRSLLLSLHTGVTSFETLEEAKKSSQNTYYDVLVLGPGLHQFEEDNPIVGLSTIHTVKRSDIGEHSASFASHKNILTFPLHADSFTQLLERLFSNQDSQIAEKRRRSSTVEPFAMPGSPSPKPSLSILIAEDNKFNQRVLIKILQTIGYNPDVVENGLEVLEALEKQEYDVILMDLQMPKMDGLEASRIISEKKKKVSALKPSIVAITADVLHGIEDECRQCGMQGYLAKPVKKQQIAEVLERLSVPIESREKWIVLR